MECVYINSNNESIALKPSRPMFLRKIDGTGTMHQTINTFRAPNQDGAYFISSFIDMRNITIEGTIVPDSVDNAFDYRKQLLNVFIPKSSGMLYFRDRRIECYVEEVSFSTDESKKYQQFFISLICPNPFFESLTETDRDLTSVSGNFIFPLEITQSSFSFGDIEPSQIIIVNNQGDVDCGVEIIFTATADVVNPELRLMETGEFVKIETTLTAGQEIHITTGFANKKVTLIDGSTITNIFALIDIDTTFFSLKKGDNTLRYDADSGIDSLGCEVKFRVLYLGV